MSMMKRVSKANPCPVCKKTDWCLIGKSLVLCMRVRSEREKTLSDGTPGYLHPLNGSYDFRPEPKKPQSQQPDVAIPSLMERYQRCVMTEDINRLAHKLGVTAYSLRALGAGIRDKNTWAFPMRNAANEIVGIRLRTDSGLKFAVTGSHQGLFIPQVESIFSSPASPDTVFLPEGPTDTAAALTLGLYAIGRPSANGGIYELVAAIKRRRFKRAVIIADNDEDKERDDGSHFNPGFDGATTLMAHMPIPCTVLALPAKDIRKYVVSGGTSELIESLLNQSMWSKPNETKPTGSGREAQSIGASCQ